MIDPERIGLRIRWELNEFCCECGFLTLNNADFRRGRIEAYLELLEPSDNKLIANFCKICRAKIKEIYDNTVFRLK